MWHTPIWSGVRIIYSYYVIELRNRGWTERENGKRWVKGLGSSQDIYKNLFGFRKKNTDREKKPVYISVIIGPPSKTRPALSVRGRPGRFVKKSAIGQLFENPSYDPLGSYQSTVASQLYWLLVSSEDVANAIGAVEMKMIHYSCFDFVKSIEYQLIVTLDLDES